MCGLLLRSSLKYRRKKTMFSMTRHYSWPPFSLFPCTQCFQTAFNHCTVPKNIHSVPLKVFLGLNLPPGSYFPLKILGFDNPIPLGISNNLEFLGGMNIFWNLALEKIPCEQLISSMLNERVPLSFGME